MRNNAADQARTVEADYERLQTMVSKQTPSPGYYNNFKTGFDRSKMRSYTMGKKIEAAKPM